MLACVAIAGLSLLVLPPAPSYDAWSWLIWGRELAGGELSTEGGPAFKPLPVAICTLLAPLGDWAPTAWVWLVRAVSLGTLVLAWTLARRLAGTRTAAAAAVAGVAFAQGWLGYAAAGDSEPLLIGAALVAAHAWLSGNLKLVLAAGLACALIRVEAWPFLLAGIALTPALRPALVPAAAVLPALWFLPELAGSGELWRSAERARVPNPGQPALAALPAAESLQRAAALAVWPLPLALAFLRPATREARAALVLCGAGLAWIVIVAVMAQAGFSGEERYALPGIAIASVGAAAGLAQVRGRALVAAAAVALAVVAGIRLAEFAPVAQRQAHEARLAADLESAVAAAGGRAGVLACGTPYTGDLRGPMTAWALGVEKRAVEFEPRGAGVVFSSRLRREDALDPAAAGGSVPAGEWRVVRRCIRAP